MRQLWSKVEWLLMGKPRRQPFLAVFLLFFGCLALSMVPFVIAKGSVLPSLTYMALGLLFLTMAALKVLPAHLSWAELGLRIAGTLFAFTAFGLGFVGLTANARSLWIPIVLMLVTVLFLLFLYRRRRSRHPQ